jgi:hypothetical protein
MLGGDVAPKPGEGVASTQGDSGVSREGRFPNIGFTDGPTSEGRSW